MIPTAQSRPGGGGSEVSSGGSGFDVPRIDDTADQMRRRREATLRLPPLVEAAQQTDGQQHGAERDVRRRELARRDPWLTPPRRPLSRESALVAWEHLASLGLGSDVVAAALGLGEVA